MCLEHGRYLYRRDRGCVWSGAHYFWEETEIDMCIHTYISLSLRHIHNQVSFFWQNVFLLGHLFPRAEREK